MLVYQCENEKCPVFKKDVVVQPMKEATCRDCGWSLYSTGEER